MWLWSFDRNNNDVLNLDRYFAAPAYYQYIFFPFSNPADTTNHRCTSYPCNQIHCASHKRRNPSNADQPLCSHMMAPAFFAESISSKSGFWATKCTSYFSYFFGFCRYKAEQKQFSLFDDSQSQEISDNSVTDSDRVLMGEHCSNTWVDFFIDSNLTVLSNWIDFQIHLTTLVVLIKFLLASG